MSELIRILHVVGNMGAGGMESLIMNWYRCIDRNKIQFDFLVHSKSKSYFEDEIIALGGRVFHLTLSDDKDLIKYIRDLKAFFSEHKEYRVVHGHHAAYGVFYLSAAKKAGIKFRIAHSHNGDYSRTLRGFLVHLFSRFYKNYANVLFACSKAAGKYMFGNRKKFTVINNGIDTSRFSFSEIDRSEVRRELGICDNSLVLVHVGRFHDQKNHSFLIDVFFDCKKMRGESILLLIGTGPLQDTIKEKVDLLGLTDSVLFLNNKKDVNRYLCASDVFVFPSLYEGLPLTVVEAQSTGLPVVCSDRVTDETKLIDSYYSLSLSKETALWASKVIEVSSMCNARCDASRVVRLKGFDCNDVAKKMQEVYIDMYSDAFCCR